MRFSNVLAVAALSVLVACGNGDTTTPAQAPGNAPTAPTAGAPTAADQGPVLAEVGDQKVYEKEFVAAAERRTPADGQNLTPDERKDVLQKLVEEKALYLEAKKKAIDEDPKVQKVMVNTLLREDVYANVKNSDFTEDQLQTYFQAHKEDFVVPEKVQIKRIFVKVGDEHKDADAKKIAQDAYTAVKKDPTKFGDVAMDKSEDPYKKRGGDLGFVGKDGKPGIDPAVVDKAFSMNQGDVSEPFMAGGGYNVLMVANKRERVERTFEQMRGSVLRKVKNDKYKEMYDSYVAGVLKEYTVNVHDDALNAAKIEPAKRMNLGMNPLEIGPDGVPGGIPVGEEPGDEGDEAPLPGAPRPGMPGAPPMPPHPVAPGAPPGALKAPPPKPAPGKTP